MVENQPKKHKHMKTQEKNTQKCRVVRSNRRLLNRDDTGVFGRNRGRKKNKKKKILQNKTNTQNIHGKDSDGTQYHNRLINK